MRRLVIIPLLLLLLVAPVAAREYCCLGPYYCEGFNSFIDARNGCILSFDDFASSYSCSHRINHDFCQSCCEIDGERFTVFSMNQCQDGTFFFQQDCSDIVSRGRILGTISASGTLDGILIKVGSASGLTLPDGRFSIPIPDDGTLTLEASDPKGRYTSVTRSVVISSLVTDVQVGALSLSTLPVSGQHVGGSPTQTILEGFVRRDGWPLSLYTVSNGGTTKKTEPNGYFRFINAAGSLTVSGNALPASQSVTPNIVVGSTTFIDVTCNEYHCEIVASASSGSLWTPDTSGDEDSGVIAYVGYFLPGPPGTPQKPGEKSDALCVDDVDCPGEERCVAGVCTEPSCSNSCTLQEKECVGNQVRSCVQQGECTVWAPPHPCPDGFCEMSGNTCVPSPSCTLEAECDDANSCTANPCLTGSCSYSNLPAGTSCTLGAKSGLCNDEGLCRVENGLCVDNGDCINGQLCVSGSCTDHEVSGCLSDVDCAAGERCDSLTATCIAEQNPDNHQGAACAQIHTCYEYTDKDACENPGDPCRVSTYGCQWTSLPKNIQGGFCKPIDALESPIMAPCERCEEFYGVCTQGSCESFAGTCTFHETSRYFAGRWTHCLPDELRACGAAGCVERLRNEALTNPPFDELEATITLNKVEKAPVSEKEEGDEGYCAQCSFQTDDDSLPSLIDSSFFWFELLLLLFVVVSLAIAFYRFRSPLRDFWSVSKERLLSFLKRRENEPTMTQKTEERVTSRQLPPVSPQQRSAQRNYQQRFEQYEAYKRLIAQQQEKVDKMHREIFDDLDDLIKTNEKKGKK